MNIHLTAATFSDCLFFYQVRNHPNNRLNSANSMEINYLDHENWFTKKLSNKANCYFVIKDEYSSVGYIRLDETKGSKWELSIALLPEYQGKKIGQRALILATEEAQNKQLKPLIAYVKENNKASIKVFQVAGFIGEDRAKDSLLTFTFY